MKKYFLILFISLIGISPFRGQEAFSQNPLVKMWDKRYGGTEGEILSGLQHTRDGGFILGGNSLSGVSGDKTQPTWASWDYWIVKLDSLGNKEWDKDFGGTDSDWQYSIHQTSDGGYILGGSSNSMISGDKSEDMYGVNDYWIIKIDSLGNKQWDKNFGGFGIDRLSDVQQTRNGDYIIAGLSNSGIGGDKTQATRGMTDYWLVKTDSLGNKIWDKDFGGTDSDDLFALVCTNDGGFLVGGASYSPAGGDKTQPSLGSMDYWIVKIDSSGNKEWDKDFGGINGDVLFSICESSDHGYLLGGWSSSGIGGDKTEDVWGGNDFWIIKIDSVGNKLWDRDLGGSMNEDDFGNISRTSDGGFVMAGTSYSPISGNKTEDNLAAEQTWVLKIDSAGNKTWDKTVFTGGHDENGLITQTSDGCYAVANYENGGIAGYKTQTNWDTTGVSADYWIVKFCETITANFLTTPDLCPGTCTNFVNTSTSATTYQWSFPGAIPNSSTDVNPASICYNTPGSYDVTLIAINATGSDTLSLNNFITVYPYPSPQGITQNADTLFANPGATSYQWYFNGIIITGATNYFYIAPASGDYNVVATDVNGCEVEAAIFNVVAGLTPAPPMAEEGVTAFPNPVSDKISIQNLKCQNSEITNISIYNLLGETVLAVSPLSFGEGSGGEADCRLLPPGMYLLQIKSSNKIFHIKFVKQ